MNKMPISHTIKSIKESPIFKQYYKGERMKKESKDNEVNDYTGQKWASDNGRRNYIYGQLDDYVKYTIDVRKRTKIDVNKIGKEILGYNFENDHKWEILAIKEAIDCIDIGSLLKKVNEHSRWSFEYNKAEVKACADFTVLLLGILFKQLNMDYETIIPKIGMNFKGYYCNYEIKTKGGK